MNEVNAPVVAKERGIDFVEEKTSTPTEFVAALTIKVSGSEDTEVTGTLFGSGEPRIVVVNGAHLEIVPEGHLLMTRHHDRPG